MAFLSFLSLSLHLHESYVRYRVDSYIQPRKPTAMKGIFFNQIYKVYLVIFKASISVFHFQNKHLMNKNTGPDEASTIIEQSG